MFNNYVRQITGIVADQYFQQVGIHANRIRYQGNEITPYPVLSNKGVQGATDGGEFQLYQNEQLQTYTVSIPEDSLIASLGASWVTAIQPDQWWEVSEDGGATWVEVRILGAVQKSRTGRYGFTLVGKGIGQ